MKTPSIASSNTAVPVNTVQASETTSRSNENIPSTSSTGRSSLAISNPTQGADPNLVKLFALKNAVSNAAFEQINKQLANAGQNAYTRKTQIAACGKWPLSPDKFLFLEDTQEIANQIAGLSRNKRETLTICLEAMSSAGELNWFNVMALPSGGTNADWFPLQGSQADTNITAEITVININGTKGRLHFIRFSADEAGRLSLIRAYGHVSDTPICDMKIKRTLPGMEIGPNPL